MHRTSIPRIYRRIALLVCAAVCGCNRSTDVPKVQTLPVTGKVTLDGEPLAGAEVFFMTADEPPVAFFATTKDDGTYQLQGVEGREAKLKGPCNVTISQQLKPDGSPVADGELPAMVQAVEQLPPKYSMPGMSQLEANVAEGGGTFDFDLKSK